MGNKDDGQEIFWKPAELLNGHVLVVGGSGSGKSETVKGITYSLDECGVPCLILDFHGDLNIKSIDKEISFGQNCRVGLNPLELDSYDPQGGGPINQMYLVADRLKNAYPTLGDKQYATIINALKVCYMRNGITKDPKTWEKEPPDFSEVEEYLLQEDSRLRHKFGKMFEYGIFSTEESLNVEDLFFESHYINLSNLPNDLQYLTAETLLRKVYRSAKMFGNIGTEKGYRLFVLVDEAKLLSPTKKNDPKAIINILGTEGRKFGIGMLISSQLTDHFGDDVLGNMATKIALKPLKRKIASKNAKEMGIEADELMGITGPGVGFVRFSNQPATRLRIKPYFKRVE